ncbi:MAG TPA: diacylglycerol kinase family protein [bacterium]
MSTWALIYNPTAGRFRADVPAALASLLAERGIALTSYATARAGHARELAAGLGDVARIVVYGGVGTLNEAANGLGPQSPPLAFLPGGTANVMAFELGLPRDPLRAARALLDAEPVPVRPGVLDGRRFLLMAGIGFDADAVQGVSPALKKRLGKGAYVLSALRALSAPMPALTLSYPAADPADAAPKAMPWTGGPAQWVVVARARHYAGPYVLHPGAGLRSERLGVVAVARGGLLPYLALSLGLGWHVRMRGVRLDEAQRLRVTADAPVHAQIDGDYYGQGTAFEIGLAEHPLRLCLPRPRRR